jgi:hypothetical protein
MMDMFSLGEIILLVTTGACMVVLFTVAFLANLFLCKDE